MLVYERLHIGARGRLRYRKAVLLTRGAKDDGYLANYVTTGTTKITGIGREVSGRHKDGGVFPIHLAGGVSLQAEGKRYFTGIIHDLSDRKYAEAALR